MLAFLRLGQVHVHFERWAIGCGVTKVQRCRCLSFGFAVKAQGLCQVKAEIVQVFAALDVVLVFVGPVQVHLAPVVGHAVGRGAAVVFAGVVALAQKVAVVVIAFKKAVQVVVNLGFGVAAFQRQFVGGAGLHDRWRRFGVCCAKAFGLFDGLGHFQLGMLHAACAFGPKSGFNFFEQILVQKLGDLLAFGVHDFVEAKVQLGFVELEQLFQQGFEAVALFVVVGAHGLVLAVLNGVEVWADTAGWRGWAGSAAGTQATCQAMVKRVSLCTVWLRRWVSWSMSSSRFLWMSSSTSNISCLCLRCCRSSF